MWGGGEEGGSSSSFGDTSNNSLLNSALINSSQDLKESVHSPLAGPSVSNSPVLLSGGWDSPSNNLDSDLSIIWSDFANIDSGLVRKEIRVLLKDGFNWSIGHDFGLDCGNVGGNIVGRLAEVKVFWVWLSDIVRVALFRARWGIWFSLWARYSARGEKVWLAPLVICKIVSGNNSCCNPIFPGLNRVSFIAESASAWYAAGKKIFHRNSGIWGLVQGNTLSVSHGLSCTESPTRTAIRLVSDFIDWTTIGPLSLGIERSRDDGGNSRNDGSGKLWGILLFFS